MSLSQYERGNPLSLGLVGALLALPVCSTAQVTASLIGTVSDESGAVISGATLSIRQTATNRERVGELGAIAVIRTFLNYFLERDLEAAESAAVEQAPAAEPRAV